MSLPQTPISKNKDLTVVNLFAGPGAGKSTTAAGLFHEMKLKHWDVELVTEFPKDLVYQQRWNMFFEQADIFTEQHHRQRRLVQYGVKYCVTDSPLLLCHMYISPDYYKNLLPLVNEAFNSFDNINIFIKRTKKYNPKGRNQTEEESRAIDLKTLDLLMDQKQKFYIVKGNERAPEKILEIIDHVKNGATIFQRDENDAISYVNAAESEKDEYSRNLVRKIVHGEIIQTELDSVKP